MGKPSRGSSGERGLVGSKPEHSCFKGDAIRIANRKLMCTLILRKRGARVQLIAPSDQSKLECSGSGVLFAGNDIAL